MIVLDTNVLSEVMRASPERAVAVWMARENPRDLFTTAITEAEILLGVAMLPKTATARMSLTRQHDGSSRCLHPGSCLSKAEQHNPLHKS